MNKQKRWTKEEDFFFDKGLTDEQIAEKTDRTLSSIRNRRGILNRAKKNGEDFTAQEKKLIASNENDKEVADKIKATIASVKAMRAWLDSSDDTYEQEEARLAAKPKHDDIEDELNDIFGSTKLHIQFGNSDMVLEKSEVNSIRITDGSIIVSK